MLTKQSFQYKYINAKKGNAITSNKQSGLIRMLHNTVENPRKQTPSRQMKLPPFGHFKLTP